VFSLMIYIPLQIAFIPLAILGAAIVGYRQIAVSRKLGISQTAIEIVNGRWTMHIFGLRDDEATARIVAALPNTSTFGLWLVLFPLWLKYRMSGCYFLYPKPPTAGSEGLAELVTARTIYFDRIIERALEEADQFVIMGAGYDARAYGPFAREGLALFELDQREVQSHKRQVLEEAGIASDRVHFVSVDFSRDDFVEKLVEAGYEADRKALFLWEGVTLYLAERQVRSTLQALRRHAAPGSVLAADFYGERFVKLANRAGARQALEATDEAIDFWLPFADRHEAVLEEFAASESMTVGERHFLGAEAGEGPFAAVAELRL
jgi:methyltransferase (TIGR00027 family)